MNPSKAIQNSFAGGLNQCEDPSKIQENQYYLLVNGRIREDTIKPTKKHLDFSAGLPDGTNIQGIYGTDNLLLVFKNGDAYYRDLRPEFDLGRFSKLPSFVTMDADVDRIYAELVPISSLNYARINQGNEISLVNPIDKSPSCVIIQDGINRPQKIYPTGFCSLAQKYDDWQQDGIREYVPIGLNMAFIGDILYLVSPDRKSILRSVTGRPLDFMVVIDKDGNKLTTEQEGGADRVSHSLSYYDIMDIKALNSFNRGFFVSTNKISYLVSPNLDNLIFGEPTFSNAPLFPTGVVNPFSITDINGDATLIDFNAIKSFNAMQSTSFEGKNTPFSRRIHNLFEYGPNNPVIQSHTAAITYDNYGLYGVNTVYGPAIVVYDCIKETNNEELWASVDLLDPINEGFVKQFCEIKVGEIRKLFFITTTGKIFEAWGSSEIAGPKIYTKERNSNDPEIENQLQFVKLLFLNCFTSGTVKVTPFIDGLKENTLEETLEGTQNSPQYPFSSLPLGNRGTKDDTKNLTFHWSELRQGFKMGLWIEWDCDAELSHIMILSQSSQMATSIEQESLSYNK